MRVLWGRHDLTAVYIRMVTHLPKDYLLEAYSAANSLFMLEPGKRNPENCCEKHSEINIG